MTRQLKFLSAFVAIVSACECGGPSLSRSDGLPEVDRTTIDFGRVRLGENKRVELMIVNRGSATLRLNGFDRSATPAVFRAGEPPQELPTGATATITLVFAPEQVGAVNGTLVLLSNSDKKPRLEIALTGEGVETMVRVEPETVNFGVVEVDSRVTGAITLRNEGEIAEDVSVLTLADGSAHFSGGPVPGGGNTIRLAPGATAELPVAFAPRWADAAGFVSSVTLLPCPTCSTITVTLRGTGVDAFLTLDPAPPRCLDFGLVNPGASVTKTVAVGNLGSLPLSVLGSEVTEGGARFSVGGTFPATVEGSQPLLIPVTYSPDALAIHNGKLVVTSDDRKANRVEVCLKGTGGGPDVDVRPTSLTFGQVAVGAPRTRTFRIANVGLVPPGAGSAPLLVESVTARSGSSVYTVDVEPFSLLIGESRTVTVTFSPDREGEIPDVLEIRTNDTDEPMVEVALSGRGRALAPCQLELLPVSGALAFGNVEKGRTAMLPFALRNVGPDDCLVDEMQLSPATNAAFTLPTAPPAQFAISPGEFVSIPVQFKPLVHASYTGQVRFVISDPAEPNRAFSLSGVSAPGCLLIAPSEIDFGVTGAQCLSTERTIDVYNVCGPAVTVTNVALADDANAAYRLVLPPDVTFPLVMTGATSLRLKVRYAPQTHGEHPGGIFVQSDERPEPYLVSLTGSAQPDAVQRDRFAQEKRPIDILFVIDDSGSMAPYQQSLATNLESFMQFANTNGVDYHIAITTTDVDTANGPNGRFVPLQQSGVWPATNATPPRVLQRNTPDVMRAFKTSVNVGTAGSGTEKGLEATYRALSPQNLAGHNMGFLRDDAMLSVIVVTDEAEQSPADLNFYYSSFLSIKGPRRANLFSFSTICEVDPLNGTNHGLRYVEMANRSGGIVSSIHTADWAADLERLGLAAFGYKSRFLLTSTPDPETIEVLINGNPVEREDEESANWWYDPVANLVEFNPHAIPEPGQSLEISYSVVCGQ